MNREKFIISIIKDTGLSRGEIEEMVEEKRAILKGKISIEDALLIIIKELIFYPNLLWEFSLLISQPKSGRFIYL